MDKPKKLTVEDIQRATVDVTQPRNAEEKLVANAIMDMLPHEYRRQIVAITRARGMNRHSRRATGALVRLGIRERNRRTHNAQARKEDKESREFDLFTRIKRRLDRGIDRPFPGMTKARYEELKGMFGVVESMTIDGQTIESEGVSYVRVKQP